jgi:hypothetical protein
MKTVIYLVIALLLISCSKEGSKTTDQPEAVQNAFKSQYSNAKKVNWENDGELYIVEFETDKMEKEVTYDKSGKIMEVEWEIAVSDLPSTIQEYIENNYPEYEIEEAEKMEKDSKIYFEVEIEGDDEELELIFDSNGSFLRVEPDDEDEEE